jgi:glutamyl-tRNA synthetase
VRRIDGVAGEQSCNVAQQLGDFVIAKADATAAYQLAVVVDDADAGVTHVVRGDDLLDSTPRQMLLYQALGMQQKIPKYYHLPLVVGPDGRRLAKRHGDTRLATYRQSGVPASRILGLLARWSGIDVGQDVGDIRSLIDRFDLSLLPRSPIVCDWQYHPTS